MKKIIKKIICTISTFAILLSASVNCFAFTQRTSLSEAECNSQYWSAPGNTFPRNWSLAGGNCTWYAYGRAWELLGYKPSLSLNGAHKWFTYNDGYERGSEPRPGAIACWSDESNTVGHVAVVEAVNGDEITLSESGWSYENSYFASKKKNKYNLDYSVGGVMRHFQGYIYLPVSYDSMQNIQSEPAKPIVEEIPVMPIINVNSYISQPTVYKSTSGIQIYLNDIYLPLSDYAQNVNGTVLVPARDLISAMGGNMIWDEVQKKLTANVRNSIFEATADSNVMFINKIPLNADAKVIISNEGRLMIPLRAAITMLGGSIIGVDSEMNVRISY